PNPELTQNLFISLLPYYTIQQVSGFAVQTIIFFLFCMTPAIIYWTDASHGKAIFYNLMACLKNWRAWVTWAATLLLIFGVLPAASYLLVYITQSVPILMILTFAIVALLSIGLIFLSMIIIPASYYFAYKDCFIQNQRVTIE
ncbi:MAG: hypothetical protein ACRCWR_11875, partial [Saezia sp.]